VAQLPYSAPDTGGDVTVSVGSDTSKAYRLELYGAAYGIFAVDKLDLSISQTNFVKPGDTVIAYVTGFGKTNPAVATGAPLPPIPLWRSGLLRPIPTSVWYRAISI
jgi:uncharacterized protein (TIGR03437 family)